MDRVILHSDCNCFYAAVEMLHHPEYDGQPLAVGGDPEKRHGIVLTANYIAKRRRFGFRSVQRGLMYFDTALSSLDAKADDHMVHPHSYMERRNRTGVEEE